MPEPFVNVPRHAQDHRSRARPLITGSDVAHIDGVAYRVGPVDISFVPAGIIHHYFENASDSEEMHIFWTYASVDATGTVVATGVATLIDEEHGTAGTTGSGQKGEDRPTPRQDLERCCGAMA